MKTLKAAVVGAGWVGKMHALAYKSNPRVKLEWIADVNEESARKMAEDLKVEYTTTFTELLEKDIQILSIATPPDTHFRMAKAALEKGVHVLVEKPITLDVKEAEILMDMTEENREVRVMVGFSERFHIGFNAVKKRIGSIGKPYMAHGWWVHRANSSKGWIWDPEKSGGAIVDLGVFLIDLFRWYFNSEVRMVECRSGNFVFNDAESEDTASMFLKFRTGAFASIDVSRFLPNSFPSPLNVGMHLYGTKGCMKVDTSMSLPLQIFTEEDTSIPDLLRTPKLWISDEINYFIENIITGKKHICTVKDGLMAIKVALGARKSAETHKKVVFN